MIELDSLIKLPQTKQNKTKHLHPKKYIIYKIVYYSEYSDITHQGESVWG